MSKNKEPNNEQLTLEERVALLSNKVLELEKQSLQIISATSQAQTFNDHAINELRLLILK
ncbi:MULTISPECIES: hypothetical protein [Providencia]|jgi:hypothetical protein|uniref:hypothetical protein n=1 Tax=Providencia TaxID=586 RepID=UPI0012B5DAF2|nr:MULTISPECIES: hypothetical protein [Providencia]MDR2224655.1 hypothetical protein [Providencia sp.]MTC72313.1 hypothetical protein [Providencia sp. wls1914]